MIKYNEAQSIRKTYEQIVKRLKDERVGFDHQLAAIEKSLKVNEHHSRQVLRSSPHPRPFFFPPGQRA